MIIERFRASRERLAFRLFAVCTILLAGYLLIDSVTPNPDVILGVRVLQATACVVVMYVYWPDVLEAFTVDRPVKGDYLSVGIFLGQLGSTFQASFVVVYRLSGFPRWLADSDINGIWIMVGVVASALHILAPDAYQNGRGSMVPKRARIAAGLGLGLAFATVMSLLLLRPNIGPYIEMLRPYLDDWFHTNRAALNLWWNMA